MSVLKFRRTNSPGKKKNKALKFCDHDGLSVDLRLLLLQSVLMNSLACIIPFLLDGYSLPFNVHSWEIKRFNFFLFKKAKLLHKVNKPVILQHNLVNSLFSLFVSCEQVLVFV